MGTKVFLVRHGETIWNVDRRFQGQTDVPLNEKGRRQAEALGRKLSGEKFAAIYASDLRRAYETAALVARGHNLPVQKCPDLREINFGCWEGLTMSDIESKYKIIFQQWLVNPLTTRIPQGENLAEVAVRSVRAVRAIINSHPDSQVLLISHGGAIRTIVSSALGIDLNQYWRLKLDNASLTVIDYYDQGDKAILELFNDCSHLSDWR